MSGMSGMTAGPMPAPRSLEQEYSEKLQQILPHLSEQDRGEAAMKLYKDLEQRRYSLSSPPPQLTNAQRIAGAAYDPSRMHPETVSDYLKNFGADCDAIKSVMEFFAAQANMDIFAGDSKAKEIYQRVIQAGLATLFQYRNYP